MEPDLALLMRYHREGDAAAFQALVKAHAGTVFATARRVTQNAAMAEEVAQDTFLALARRAQTVRDSVAAWLHHVARQKACNALRGELRRQRHERDAAALREMPESPWSEIEPVIDEIIDEMPALPRAMLIGHYLEQRSQQELARQSGVSQSTISRQLEAALQMLRDALQRKGVVCVTGLSGVLAAGSAEAAPATLIASLNKMAIAGIGSGSAASAVGVGFLLTMNTATKVILTIVLLAAGTLPFLLPEKSTPKSAAQAKAKPAPAPSTSVAPPAKSTTPPPRATASVPDQPKQNGYDDMDDRQVILAEFQRMGGSLTAIGEEWLDGQITDTVRRRLGGIQARPGAARSDHGTGENAAQG
jgi:RNA polymerase sigma factor (sigma-70 family)